MLDWHSCQICYPLEIKILLLLLLRPSVRPSVDQVKIFGQGRISRPSKLIFYMRVYLYETSRDIQEP